MQLMQDRYKKFLFTIGLLFFTTVTLAQGSTPTKLTTKERVFIKKMVKQHHFDESYLTRLLQQAHYQQRAVHLLHHPFEKKPWDYYQNYFITTERIKHGVTYWHQHQQTLDRITKKYGVPASVIVAIIGVESHYGKHIGKFPELDTLSTLAFHQTTRSDFFQRELEKLLLLARRDHLKIQDLTGSYAGALGIPQFMPSSYLFYGIDDSHNKRIDLLHNHKDAIASIANYLHKAGWHSDQPVAYQAYHQSSIKPYLISADAKVTQSIRHLWQNGIRVHKPLNRKLKAALIAMHKTQGDEYWVVFKSFNAIMAYNPRTTYALAVYLLSQRIKQNYEQSTT